MLRLYNALLPAARLAAPLLALGDAKLRVGWRGRKGVVARLVAQAAELRGRVVWMHSTSVGEYEQARPLVALLAAARPELAVLHTFFSPSGYDYARRLGEAAYYDYLPFDDRNDVSQVLDALQPRLLVLVKFDLWPNLVVEAARRGVPVTLVDATLQPRSRRQQWPARSLYRQLYRRLACISAVSPADAERFRALVPEHPAIFVDGDTRFDQVLRRREAAAKAPIPDVLRRRPRPFTFLAGSTWPADERTVLAAWCAWRAADAAGQAALTERGAAQSARLVLVPHEPTPSHLQALEKELTALGLQSTRFSALVESEPAEVVLVDRVGVLAELYADADAAYVGGAFGRGVHNVIEPAIMGLPLFFGPGHHNAPEAEMLLETGAAAVIRSSVDLERQLQRVAGDTAERLHRGGRARAFVAANLGASERCLQRLLQALEASPTPVREPG
ncbi:MAG TPA: glycosyltransferase N-terminal domain-containing protein [Candidatus Krumholzibacteria bacterium]|nr:glycosyltransferase N-terminal domain-containing protein [Candidatus Krumholzibacteria bacterium]